MIVFQNRLQCRRSSEQIFQFVCFPVKIIFSVVITPRLSFWERLRQHYWVQTHRWLPDSALHWHMVNKELHALFSDSNNELLPAVFSDGHAWTAQLCCPSQSCCLCAAFSWTRSALQQESHQLGLPWNTIPVSVVCDGKFSRTTIAISWDMMFDVCPVLGSQRQNSNQQSGTTPTEIKEVWIHPMLIFHSLSLAHLAFPMALGSLCQQTCCFTAMGSRRWRRDSFWELLCFWWGAPKWLPAARQVCSHTPGTMQITSSKQ